MIISRLGRHLREGFRNLIRNGWMTFASVSAVAITLLILGASLVIALNAERMSSYVSGQLQITVLLQLNVQDDQGQQIATAVRQIPGVKSVQFISKEEGFARLKNELGNNGVLLQGLSANSTLPVELVVKAADPRQQVGIAQEIKSLPGVDVVNDGHALVDKFFRFLDIVRNIGLVFVVALLITVMFLISNTIKLTIFARRREIEIMRLVGATDWFIRWPFVMEAVLIGFVGAAIPFGLIIAGYHLIFARIGGSFLELSFPLLPTIQLASRLAGVMFGIGVLVGLWGGIMSVRKFLRI